MQNVWPINRYSEIGFDRARMIYGIAEGTAICFCSHVVTCMIEVFDDTTTSLPFAGLITKILRFRELNIPPNETIQVPQGFFGKATVQKSKAQLQGRDNALEVPVAPAPIAGGDPDASSSSLSPVSRAALMEQITAMAKLMSGRDRRQIGIDER